MEKADLNYSITFSRLWGKAGGNSVSLSAVSGGRAGSTTPGAVDTSIANNVFQIGTRTDHKHHVHGGPLPIGRYTVAAPQQHPHLGLSAKLTPASGGLSFGMFGRGGFFIHGRGPHGSDGCIVPLASSDLHQLMQLITKSQGGTLTVLP